MRTEQLLLSDEKRVWAGWAGVVLLFFILALAEDGELAILMGTVAFWSFLVVLIQWNVVRDGWDFLAFLGRWFVASLLGGVLGALLWLFHLVGHE